LHATIAQVTRDMEVLKYNTAIAALMKYLNTLDEASGVSESELRALVRLLAPFAPFVTDELWERLGGETSIHTQAWPEADEGALRVSEQTLVVQVNGRLRDRVTLPAELPPDEITRFVLSSERVRRYLEGRTVRNVVHVPGRLVNVVLDDAG
jgi:leucyl-tRNA synthetase